MRGMAARDFKELVSAKWDERKFLCIGLDSEFEKLPEHLKKHGPREGVSVFNAAIVEATKDIVCAYKPNSAFYEANGEDGLAALKATIAGIHAVAPDVPVILDAKRADIGNTNSGYVVYAFEYLQADGLTVHPYMGGESLKEFLGCNNKGIFVQCRNSNPGADEFQDLIVGDQPLYMHVAKAFADQWNHNNNCGLVVGATHPEEMKAIRAAAPELPFLIPGIGSQGGALEASVKAGRDARGGGMIISASRSVIFASSGNDFAEAAHKSAQELHSAIQKVL